MDKDTPATSNDTLLPVGSVAGPKSGALNQPEKTPIVRKLALTTLIVIGAALVLAGVLLVAVVSFVFIQ